MVSSRESSVSAEFERECVAFFAGVVGVLGVPPSVGQIYGLLFASPEPLSFTDILEVLNASKGSVSHPRRGNRDHCRGFDCRGVARMAGASVDREFVRSGYTPIGVCLFP
jgi:hypothetical protein